MEWSHRQVVRAVVVDSNLSRKIIKSRVLEQAKLRIRNANPRNDLDIDLNAFAWMRHLLVGFRFIMFFRLFRWRQTHFPHDPEQAFWAAGIAALAQAVP